MNMPNISPMRSPARRILTACRAAALTAIALTISGLTGTALAATAGTQWQVSKQPPTTPAASSVPATSPLPSSLGGTAEDPDADASPSLYPASHGCHTVMDTPQPVVIYEFATGIATEPTAQPGYPRYGRATYHKLYVGCVYGAQYEHLSSFVDDRTGRITVDSLAFVARAHAGKFSTMAGIGVNHYRVMNQHYNQVVIPLGLRLAIAWGLSVEGSAEIPLGAFFPNQVEPNSGNYNQLTDIALRYEWRNVALKLGTRSYKLSYDVPGPAAYAMVQRNVHYVGITLKY